MEKAETIVSNVDMIGSKECKQQQSKLSSEESPT